MKRPVAVAKHPPVTTEEQWRRHVAKHRRRSRFSRGFRICMWSIAVFVILTFLGAPLGFG
jgi:hypothetical protein